MTCVRDNSAMQRSPKSPKQTGEHEPLQDLRIRARRAIKWLRDNGRDTTRGEYELRRLDQAVRARAERYGMAEAKAYFNAKIVARRLAKIG